MENIIKLLVALIDKISIHKLIIVVTGFSAFILFAPLWIINYLALNGVLVAYKFIFSTIFIIGIFLEIIRLGEVIEQYINSPKKKAIRYLKNELTIDEKGFLIRTFYDPKVKRFRETGQVDALDGSGMNLVRQGIIYRSSSLGQCLQFDYNLEIFAYNYLNGKYLTQLHQMGNNDD